jgi:omega-amidase
MRITTVQTQLVWEDKNANYQHIENLLSGIKRGDTDVIVLPEMFSTGFSMQPERLAEPLEGSALYFLKRKAWELDAVITGSFICEDKGNYYNRLVWMQPDGNFQTYDKRHRFTLAGEDKHYTEGGQKLIVEWRGWRFCPLICYDLRFPVWSRNVTPYYDVLIYVANWPQIRRYPWQSLLVARAIENQSYVIGVNRVGADGNGFDHSGDSSVIDYAGEILFRRSFTEGVETTILSRENLDKFRQKFGFLRDGDYFQIVTD